ncbi:tetratricopeptide repeat protein [Ancylothrix sp. C2]|uniref:tetratricopeptide repeat protein n=1 Tax=Ancylothrix sp. D3o TaxID=2953691 RepID=UPI0021BB21A6|nr:tetratricopeptide repeat protein [Ancylothrix sp. D3o]MCT7950291.1 tetratricopeptide repeat protein [Ancylothrix sp. D3o]
MNIDQVAAAFEGKNYQEAAKLLKVLLKESPENPWVQVYVGKMHEVSGKKEEAEKVYRDVLRSVTHPKIVAAARQGLQRLEDREKQRRQQAIEQAKADPTQQELGILLIEPINRDNKAELAKNFARVMQLDPYTARLLLPTRNWRLYRTGRLGELQVYVRELKNGGIGAFCVSYPQIETIKVFEVSYFKAVNPKGVVVCKNENDQLGQISFEWAEVAQQVEGLIPIFKAYADFDLIRDKVDYKEQTQDFAHVWDLHLPRRRCILRLINQHYDFQQGMRFTPPPVKGMTVKPTVGESWGRLTNCLMQKVPKITTSAEFLPFGESVVREEEALSRIKPQLNLFRRSESNWDPAFELFSRLVFLKSQMVEK